MATQISPLALNSKIQQEKPEISQNSSENFFKKLASSEKENTTGPGKFSENINKGLVNNFLSSVVEETKAINIVERSILETHAVSLAKKSMSLLIENICFSSTFDRELCFGCEFSCALALVLSCDTSNRDINFKYEVKNTEGSISNINAMFSLKDGIIELDKEVTFSVEKNGVVEVFKKPAGSLTLALVKTESQIEAEKTILELIRTSKNASASTSSANQTQSNKDFYFSDGSSLLAREQNKNLKFLKKIDEINEKQDTYANEEKARFEKAQVEKRKASLFLEKQEEAERHTKSLKEKKIADNKKNKRITFSREIKDESSVQPVFALEINSDSSLAISESKTQAKTVFAPVEKKTSRLK